MRELACEELCLFFAQGDPDAEVACQAAAAFDGRGDSRNAPFLHDVSHEGGFLFLTQSHCSVEALGTGQFVVGRCLPPVLRDVLLGREQTAG